MKPSELGRLGEVQAVEWFLAHEPVQLIARNYRCKAGEIDLIFETLPSAQKPIELIFVEVKTRKDPHGISAISNVSWRKQKCMQRTIQYFLLHYSGLATQMRIDFLGKNGAIWEHRRNIQ